MSCSERCPQFRGVHTGVPLTMHIFSFLILTIHTLSPSHLFTLPPPSPHLFTLPPPSPHLTLLYIYTQLPGLLLPQPAGDGEGEKRGPMHDHDRQRGSGGPPPEPRAGLSRAVQETELGRALPAVRGGETEREGQEGEAGEERGPCTEQRRRYTIPCVTVCVCVCVCVCVSFYLTISMACRMKCLCIFKT